MSDWYRSTIRPNASRSPSRESSPSRTSSSGSVATIVLMSPDTTLTLRKGDRKNEPHRRKSCRIPVGDGDILNKDGNERPGPFTPVCRTALGGGVCHVGQASCESGLFRGAASRAIVAFGRRSLPIGVHGPGAKCRQAEAQHRSGSLAAQCRVPDGDRRGARGITTTVSGTESDGDGCHGLSVFRLVAY